MADVILIKLENEKDDSPLAPPFGILYLASALEKAGLSVALRHERGTRQAVKKIAQEVVAERPVMAGFSCMTGPALKAALDASRLIKESSDVPVVWGGVHPTLLPDQVLTGAGVDFVVLGEGELTVVELAKLLREGMPGQRSLDAVRGIAYKNGNEVKTNPPRPLVPDLDEFAPAWHLLDRKRYVYQDRYFYSDGGSKLPGGRIFGLITSRGCPWRCGYCYHEAVHRRTFRAHSAERVIREIGELKREEGITAVNFEDANFFVDRERALRIVREAKVSWGSSMRADTFARWGESFAAEIRDAGCEELQIGAESGSQRILDLIAKDISTAHIRESARLGRKFGIRLLFSFMMGIPGETWADVEATLRLMDELRTSGGKVVTNGPFFYFPFPGTPLYDLAVEKGFRPPARTEDWNFGLWGIHQPLAPYVEKRTRFIEHYRRMAWENGGDEPGFALLKRPLSALARWRWHRRSFRFPLDYHFPRLVLRLARALRKKERAREGPGIGPALG